MAPAASDLTPPRSGETDVEIAGTHRRAYQACIPCRKRKVRCDLGSVDDPHEPPCVRCRRESKECRFTNTRKRGEAEAGGDDAGEADTRSGSTIGISRRKGLEAFTISDPPITSHDARHSIDSSPASTPTRTYNSAQQSSIGQAPRYTTQPTIDDVENGQDQEVTNEAAAALFQTPINTPGDALHLLLKASGQSEEFQRRNSSDQSLKRDSRGNQVRAAGDGTRLGGSDSHRNVQEPEHSPTIDPAISGNRHDRGTKEALQIWSRLRFVRAGWFTAREAMSYIDYYYQYLEPLTPVTAPDLRNVEANPDVLSEEPMLTVTVLTIASRYMKLAGPGSQTRSYMVHERLWQYLQSLITRMFWGQEQFGGGFSGAGQIRRPEHIGKGRLRTLGTIESLLLLSDYHPRSMHFPPNDDDEDLLAPAEEPSVKPWSPEDDQETGPGSESAFSGWTEPALRSDRMSWSLIGLSYALAYELGVFGTYSDGMQSVDVVSRRSTSTILQSKRAFKIEKLLYIYVTQACGRFGFPSPYPDHVNKAHMSDMRNRIESGNLFLSPEDEIQQLWAEVAVINKACNDTLFPSKDLTAQFIRSGDYIVKLQQLQPVLQAWQRSFDNSNGILISKYPRLALSIEFHYFRFYINGLALQAVLEKWTTKVGSEFEDSSPKTPGSSVSSSFASLYSQNEYYIKQVVDAARTVLRHVVDGLLPDDYLKHASVRIYFRIVSAAMFLLKTFALGAKEEEVKISLTLLDNTIKALRTSVVDDVHLCLRIADLLESLTLNIRNKFVRLPPQMTNSLNHPRAGPSAAHHGTSNYAPSTSNPPHPVASPNPGYSMQDPLAGIPATHTNPYDANITIMPPPGGSYTHYNYNNNSIQQQQMYQQQQNPSAQQASLFAMDDNLPFPSQEDWLTLDLNNFLEANNLGNGENQWYGAFGPEGQWQPGDLGFQ